MGSQIAHTATFDPKSAQYGELDAPLHPQLAERLRALGLDRFYSHQAAAYNAAMAGEDVAVVTGTNSGKTLCYNLPALQWSLTEPAARMLYLFPTKALAQDQLGKLELLSVGPQIKTATYDGDTPPSQRSSIRRLAHIVLSNPDMLHVGILPGHENWTKFLRALRLIVIDEMHVYRGVFGSHVGNVIRRLLRLCEWHHSRPQIIGCSATIGNPAELFQKLTGRSAKLIDEDGAPRAKRTFIFWNPPSVGENQKLSANVVTSELLATNMESGLRTLAFNRARISTELVLRYTKRRLKESEVRPEKVESYRSGYTAKERRQIEQALFKGDLLGLSATNAMELGVDVGGLDAVIMNGYPGSISSFFQQAGRAGRGTREGLAIMVAHDDPLEQFITRNPDVVMQGTRESAVLNPENPKILGQQLLCASHERALTPSELENFGSSAIEVAETLDRSGELCFKNGLFFYPSHEPPALSVNIRGGGGDQISLVLDGTVLGTMERWRAMQSAHDGAVYLHRGQGFVVQKLDLDAMRAELAKQETDYYTQPILQSVLEPGPAQLQKQAGTRTVSVCQVKVTSSVVGFRRKSLDGDNVLSIEPLELPPNTYETVAVRIDLPALNSEEDVTRQLGGIHGLEHSLMSVAPLIAGCDRADLGSSWYSAFADTFRPAVFVYDQTPGGVGFCEKLFQNYGKWTSDAFDLLNTCECEGGCPACLMSSRCEVANDVLDKRATLDQLQSLSP